MRLYTFTNMYLSQIQKGIQTAHIVGELAKNNNNDFKEWASDHKTIIVLNGGYSSAISELQQEFSAKCAYSSACFWESEEALGGALTAFGIILPEQAYTDEDHWIKQKLIQFNLA